MSGTSSSFQTVPEDSGSDLGDDEVTGIGLSAPNLNDEIRRKLDAMNKLHNTGVQIDIDLPQIAVIGNQSAGKSSLIEAVSGITLPRASGTCTRCPTECRLTRTDAPWQCIVSLRITTDDTGKALGQARNEQFGDIIYDKSEVEERIRRAQRAILSPQSSLNSQVFLTERETEATTRKQLPFSLNCITLAISGPDVADLSFCDLPGLIASVSRGSDDGSIALVEKMVASYILKPSCIILLTVTCETDFENQGAYRLAKKYDPEGKRTIGVLTKPDRIPLGEESSWIPFIRDEKEPLENNWFCVKLLSSHELIKKYTWAQTRQLEEDFFAEKSGPWAEVEEPYRKYLGTTNLVERLSTVLSDLIATRVPQIQDELERSIAHTREQIARLPPPPTADPRSEILTLLHMFVQDVSQNVKGVPDEIDSNTPSGLIQSISPEQEKFKRAIRATAPQFWPFEKTITNGKLPAADFLRSEEGEGYEGLNSGKPVASPKICIDEVYNRIQKARTRELPGHVPSVVGETYIRNIIKQWEAPSETLIKAVYNIVTKHLKQMVHDHFNHFGQGKLEQQVRAIVQGHINACLAKAEYGVKYQRKLEQSWPFTMNTHYLSDYKEKFLAYYRSAREEQAKNAKTVPFQSLFATPPVKSEFNTIGKADASKTAAGSTSAPITSLFSSSTNTSSTPFTSFFSSSTNTSSTPITTGSLFGPVKAPETAPTTSFFSSSANTSSTPITTGSPFKPLKAPETPKISFPPSNAPLFPPSSLSTSDGSAAVIVSPFTTTQAPKEESTVNTFFAGPGKTVNEADATSTFDPMEPALVIMADVRAYFQVAYKRFIDYVPLAVDAELVTGIVQDLLPTLFSQLGINGPKGDAICRDYAQENRKVASRRVELTKKLERLEAGHNELFTAFV